MKFTPRPPEIKVRRRVRGPFGEEFPEPSLAIYQWAMQACNGRSELNFSIPRLPPTVNHMYLHSRGKKILSPEAREFRELVAVAIGSSWIKWKPTGAVASLIFLQSPHWVTKRGTIRDMDGDNRLKPIFDAVQAATSAPDSTNWQMHPFKVSSSQVKTSVYLWDLGDLIDFFP